MSTKHNLRERDFERLVNAGCDEELLRELLVEAGMAYRLKIRAANLRVVSRHKAPSADATRRLAKAVKGVAREIAAFNGRTDVTHDQTLLVPIRVSETELSAQPLPLDLVPLVLSRYLERIRQRRIEASDPFPAIASDWATSQETFLSRYVRSRTGKPFWSELSTLLAAACASFVGDAEDRWPAFDEQSVQMRVRRFQGGPSRLPEALKTAIRGSVAREASAAPTKTPRTRAS